MALTATLALNIAQFETGLSRATASLEGFAQKTVKNTNRDLAQMLEGFTGQKVVAESARMAEAVERVGGASRLTEAEQRRVNATVTEAIEKYRVLGQEAPAQLVKLQKETAGAVEKTSVLSKGVQALIGIFSIRAIARAAGDVLEFTGNLADMSAKTGIGVEALQRLKYVTEQSGVSLEQVADGAVKLGRNLITGNDSAVKGVQALRLSVSDLVALGPEKAFLAIGEAIAKVPNPMEQAAIATAIFGRAGADYLPAFTSDMSALADQAQAAGVILSKDLVESGNRAGDAITRLEAAGLSVLGNFFLPIMPAVEMVANFMSTTFPSAMRASQEAISGLIFQGMQLEVWLSETAESIARAVADVPVLGRVFGQTAADVSVLEERTRHAKDALEAFNFQGVGPATKAATAAAPALTAFGQSLGTVATASRRAATVGDDLGVALAAMAGWEDKATAATARLAAEQRRSAQDGLAMFMSLSAITTKLEEQFPYLQSTALKWTGFAQTVKQSSATATTESGSFFDRLKAGMSEAGTSATSLSGLFQQAFLGGGGATGALKAFATQGMSALIGMIPGIPPWLKQFAGPIVEGLSKLAAKGRDILASMFGGPSSSEKTGRASVAAFEQSLHGALTATQELEAGGEDWKKTVIAIRDAYIAAGRTEQEALAAAEKLWKSSTISAEESLRVIEEIKAIMHALPTSKTIEIDVKYNDDGSPANPGGLPTNATQPVGPFIPPAPSSAGMSQSAAAPGPVVVVVTTIRRDDIDPVEIGNMAAAAVAQHYPRNGFDLKTIITDSLREA